MTVAESGHRYRRGVTKPPASRTPRLWLSDDPDGDTLIVLLGGGTKARQQRDIEQARELWQEYRRRKQQGM